MWLVVTTINPPTEAIKTISEMAANGWSVIVVGDRKTPPNWSAPNIEYISIENQKELFGELATLIPYNHYCRKNLGYLYAIRRGADCILETDDDNIPYEDFGQGLRKEISAKLVKGARWINIYKYFSDEHIWPRGLPLEEIRSVGSISSEVVTDIFPIQQFLADIDPDVDAIYRMIVNKEVVFNRSPTIGVDRGCWVPFNSQNTLFFKEAYPLLYLPCHVSFRMTDIWRSFVAQQALWVCDYRIAFHAATVKQVRNAHDLTRDFADEVPGYLNNQRIIQLLTERAKDLDSSLGLAAIARELWVTLHKNEILPDIEMTILDCWFDALSSTVS